MLGVGGIDSRGGQGKPSLCDTEAVPLGKFGPCLSSKLRVRIGRYDPSSVLKGGHSPKDKPRHFRALTDAMAA